LILQSHTNLLPSDADREREAAYQRAIEVDARMTGLQQSLNTLVADLNAATGQVTSSQDEKENSGVGQIVQLLNNHHETLVWLENTTKSLERDLAVIGRSTNSTTRI
jgi:nuclear pore complex protein Nup62